MSINLGWIVLAAFAQILVMAGMALFAAYIIIRLSIYGYKVVKTSRQNRKASQKMVERPRYASLPANIVFKV